MDFDPLLMAAVLGLVNFAKDLGLSGKAVTILAATVGVGASWAAGFVDPTVFKQILDGVLFGLAASGFYDGGKAVIGALKRR